MGWTPVDLLSKEELAAARQEFNEKARFLVDESLGVDVADLLRCSRRLYT